MKSRADHSPPGHPDGYEPPAVLDLGTLGELTQGVQPSGSDMSAIFSLSVPPITVP